jgi:hypothetical protein
MNDAGKGRIHYQLVKMAIDPCLVQVRTLQMIRAGLVGIMVVGQYLVEIGFWCHAQGKNHQQEGGNRFSYSLIQVQ